jgi:hypothetical protein
MIPFEFYRVRLHLRAQEPLRFPAPAANLLRGALGYMLRAQKGGPYYTRWFRPGGEPETGPTPSGLADWPRPFVLRASHLDGVECKPEECWSFDLHIFARKAFWPLVEAVAAAAGQGIGRGRVASELMRIEVLNAGSTDFSLWSTGGTDFSLWSAPIFPISERSEPVPPIRLNLADVGERADRISLRFVTPTELKGQAGKEPDFGTLFARLRDRLGNLAALYGAGALDVDFQGFGERARSVRLCQAQLSWERAERRSSRTGQVHPLSGFTGDVDYEGDLGEFLPWLDAARWVGVGRQTVWGKGDVRVIR